MKKEQDKLNHIILVDEVLETTINEKTKQIETEARASAQNLAIEKLPRMGDSHLAPYIGHIASSYKELVFESKKRLQFENQQKEDKQDELHVTKQVSTNQAKVKEIYHQAKSIENQKNKIKDDFDWTKYTVVLFILVLLGMVEVLVDGSSLQNLGFNKLVSYIYGAGIGITVIIISHQLKAILDKAKSRQGKISLFILISSILALVFWTLAYFRMDVFDSMASETTAEGSLSKVLSFMLLNLIIFWGASLLSYFYLPSSEDDKNKMRLKKLNKSLNEYQQEVNILETENKTLEEDLHQRKVAREKNKEYAKYLLEWIETLYEKAVGQFITTNIQNRRDGIPKCFTQEIPTLFPNNKNDKK